MSDFECCEDGKCDDFYQQVADGMAASMAREIDTEVIHGTESTA